MNDSGSVEPLSERAVLPAGVVEAPVLPGNQDAAGAVGSRQATLLMIIHRRHVDPTERPALRSAAIPSHAQSEDVVGLELRPDEIGAAGIIGAVREIPSGRWRSSDHDA